MTRALPPSWTPPGRSNGRGRVIALGAHGLHQAVVGVLVFIDTATVGRDGHSQARTACGAGEPPIVGNEPKPAGVFGVRDNFKLNLESGHVSISFWGQLLAFPSVTTAFGPLVLYHLVRALWRGPTLACHSQGVRFQTAAEARQAPRPCACAATIDEDEGESQFGGSPQPSCNRGGVRGTLPE